MSKLYWVRVNQQKTLGSTPAVPLKISPKFSKDAAFSSCKSGAVSLGPGYNMGHCWTEVSVSRKVIVELIPSGHSTIITTNILTVDKLFVPHLKN